MLVNLISEWRGKNGTEGNLSFPPKMKRKVGWMENKKNITLTPKEKNNKQQSFAVYPAVNALKEISGFI